MKGTKKSRLAERINRSRQLRQQLGSSNASVKSTSQASVATADNHHDKSQDESYYNDPQSNVRAESPASLPPTRSQSPAAADSGNKSLSSRSSRARTLVEKRRKAMQRVCKTPDPLEETKSDETPRPTSVSPPLYYNNKADRNRRYLSPTLKQPEPRRFVMDQEAVDEGGHSEGHSDVAATSEASTTVSSVLNKAWGDEFASPNAVRPKLFEPLHKQYQKGKQATPTNARNEVKSPIPQNEAPVSPKSGRGRALLVANALKSATKATPKQTEISQKSQEPGNPEPWPEDSQRTEAKEQIPRKLDMSGVKSRIAAANNNGASNVVPLRKVVSEQTDETEMETEEEFEEKAPSSPKVSVSAMKARYGQSSPGIMEKSAPPQPRRNTPAWVNRAKVASPGEETTRDEETLQTAASLDTEEQELVQHGQQHQQQEDGSYRTRSPSPTWVGRKVLSPVPRPTDPRPVASASPSWAKPKLPPATEQSQPARTMSPTVVGQPLKQGIASRSVSASPVPRTKQVSAAPSWRKRPGSPSIVVQDENEAATGSLPLAPKIASRAPSPSWSKTPSWVKPAPEAETTETEEQTGEYVGGQSMPMYGTGPNRTKNWLQQRQQGMSSPQPPHEVDEETEQTSAQAGSQPHPGSGRTMNWLQQRKQERSSPQPPPQTEEPTPVPVNTQPIRGGGGDIVLNWLQQRRGVSSPQPPKQQEMPEETSAQPPENSQPFRETGGNRTLDWLQKKKEGALSFQPPKREEVVSKEASRSTPVPSQTSRAGGASRTLNWLRQREDGVVSPELHNEGTSLDESALLEPKLAMDGGGNSRTMNWLQQRKVNAPNPQLRSDFDVNNAPRETGMKEQQGVNSRTMKRQGVSVSPQPLPKEKSPGAQTNTPSWVKQRELSPTSAKGEPVESRQTAPSWTKKANPEPTSQTVHASKAVVAAPVNVANPVKKSVATSWTERAEKFSLRSDIPEQNDPEPDPVNSNPGVAPPGESDEPSRFAPAYVQRVASKPADAIKPQVRKDSPPRDETVGWPTSTEKHQVRKESSLPKSFRPSHESSWNKYNRPDENGDFEASSQLSSIPPPPQQHERQQPASPPPSSELEGPSEEFTPKQLRARFQALEKQNMGVQPVDGIRRSPWRPSQRMNADQKDEVSSQYDDPPLADFSDPETEIVDERPRSRATIETPEKVSVSAMAGRFGTVRGKQPKKTPPRVVRPNDYWRSPVEEKNTPEPPSLTKPVQRRRKLAPPSWPNQPLDGAQGNDEYVDPDQLSIQNLEPEQTNSEDIEPPFRLQSRTKALEARNVTKTSPPRNVPKDETPWWLKQRFEEENFATNEQIETEAKTKPLKPSVPQGKRDEQPKSLEPTRPQEIGSAKTTPSRKKEEDIPWWLRPKKEDEGIKKVLQRAVQAEQSTDHDREFVIEEKLNPTPPPSAQSDKASERRRRFDELLEIQITSSSENDMDMEFASRPNPSPDGRRVGVIQSWHARSRQTDQDEIDTKDFDQADQDKINTKDFHQADQDDIGIKGNASFDPLEDNLRKANTEWLEQDSSRAKTRQNMSSGSMELFTKGSSDEEENLFAAEVEWPVETIDLPVFSPPIPEFGSTEEKPKPKTQSQNDESFTEELMPNVTAQPWRTDVFFPEQADSNWIKSNAGRFEPLSRGPSKHTESPGLSPLKPQKTGRQPPYQAPLVKSSSSSPKQQRPTVFGLPSFTPIKSSPAPFEESTMINDTSDLVIVEPENKEPRTKQRGRFALIRATASVDSIELEPIDFSTQEKSVHSETEDNASPDRSRGQRPWEKDMKTLSPQTWQRKHFDDEDRRESAATQVISNRGEIAEEKKSATGDELPASALSPNSLSRLAADSIHAVDYNQAVTAMEPKRSLSNDDEYSRGTAGNIPAVLPPEFANSLSQGFIHDVIAESSIGPTAYGAAGGNDALHDTPAFADRASGLGDINNEQERNHFFFAENGRGGKEIFKDEPNAFVFKDRSEKVPSKGARGASSVLNFWSSASKDELDEAQDWKDVDPDIDDYSDTIVEDDSPQITVTSRLMSCMPFTEQDNITNRETRQIKRENFDAGAEQPPMKTASEFSRRSRAELDPFSLEAVAALCQAASSSPKKRSFAFDPFGDAFGDSIDFSTTEPDGLFAPSSSSDLSSKKNPPTLAKPKKDTEPINLSGATKRTTPNALARVPTPPRTDSAPPKVLGTPPRSPTRRSLNVNQLQDDLNKLAPSRDFSHDANDKKVLRAPSGDEDDTDDEDLKNEFSPNRDVSVWSFEQGLSSYDDRDRYDADVETIDVTTLDDSHACEI